jgi:6-phosphogluconate dehydrogenase
LSAVEEDRTLARKAFGSDTATYDGADHAAWITKIRDAMYASKICSYSQGFALLQRASATHNYGLRLADIARIWRDGCIIRASFLDRVSQAFAKEPDLPNLLASDSFADDLRPRIGAWRETVALGAKLGIPLPAMSASLSCFETLRRDRLPASLLRAQRDCFGAHTYKRIDRPGSFHTQWT